MRTALERHAALLVLGAGALLAGAAVLFSAGSSSSRLVWLGLAALALAAAAGTAAAAGWRPVLSREAVIAFALLVAFVCWCGLSVLWSIEPDRSWDYFNRGLVYVAFAVVGLGIGAFVPRAARLWAYVLAVLIALALGWALLGKAVPWIGGSGRVARLSSPVDYWNGLALLFDLGLPLALWLAARREHPHWVRAAGTVFLYGLTVGLLLTLSRAGLGVGVVAVAVWLGFGGPRVEGSAAAVLGGAAGLVVGVWALSRPGLADDAQAPSVRVHDGAWFAVVFVLAAVAVGALAYLGSLAEERRPLTDARRRRVERLALGALVAVVAVGVVALVVEAKPEGWFRDFTAQPTNAALQGGPQHLVNASSSSRWLWWKEAWHAWEKSPWRGTGAGTFELTHRLLRTNTIVVTEPHNLPLQFLSETGLVGFFLVLAGFGAAGVGVIKRLHGRRDPPALALAIRDEPQVVWSPLPAVVAACVALSLLTPWFAQRDTDSAQAAIFDGRPLAALRDARNARSLNPLALDPRLAEGAALEQLGAFQDARKVYIQAVELQPLNWRAWFELGRFEESQRDWPRALPALRRAVELDPQNPLTQAELAAAQAAS